VSENAPAAAPLAVDERAPLLVIQPGSAPLAQYARDLWHHRDLIRVMAVRDITLRYRQTALGAIWVVLQPLLSAGILSFVFGRLARLPTDGNPVFLFTFGGMLAWNCFANSLSRVTSSQISNAALVRKIFFPRLCLPLSSVFGTVIDFCVPFVVLVVMLTASDRAPDARILLLPFWIAIAIMLAQGVGSILASFAVRYRDIPQVTPVLVQLLLYASPVAYSASAVPAKYVGLYFVNPMASLLGAVRWSLLGTPFPSTGWFVYTVVVAVGIFFAGLLTMERMERSFADVI
jgi:lipopolysaccharide transport system permease protein